MSAPIVRFQSPQLPSAEHIERYFARSRDDRWFSNDGPCARLLVERLEDYVGQGVAIVPVANATLGLMVALEAVAGSRRDEGGYVLVPSFTYVASVDAIRWAGFEPLFCDVDGDAWHMLPAAIEAAAAQHGPRLAAVMACSTFGAAPPAETTAGWHAACRRHGVPLVVDSAAGFGSITEQGTPLGAQGDVEVFSFHATKPFAIGEGGIVCSSDPEMAQRLHRLVTFGLDGDRRVTLAGGLNAKMSEIHAATALAALDDHGTVLAARRALASRIREAIQGEVAFQAGAEHSTWQFVPVALPDEASRDAVLANAARLGVQMRVYHEPLHRMAAFDRHPHQGTLETTTELGARVLCLPMANDLSDRAVELIADAVVSGCRSAEAAA